MQDREKVIICQNYDSLLNNYLKIGTLGKTHLISFEEPISNGTFIKEHLNILYNFANKTASDLHFSVGINEIIQYVHEPDFLVQTYYPIHLYNHCFRSILQTMIVAEVEEQVLIEKKQKIKSLRKKCKMPLIPIIHIVKTKFADNLYYFKEETVFLNEQQFEQISYYIKNEISIKKCISIGNVPEDLVFKEKLWEILNKRSDMKYTSVPSGFYSSLDVYSVLFSKSHDLPLESSNWINKRYEYFDNRNCYIGTMKEVPLVKQFKKK